MSILATAGVEIAKAVAMYGIGKVYGWIANYMSGGKSANPAASQASDQGGVSNQNGIRSTKLPSGATVEEVDIGPPEFQKNMPAYIEEYMANPEEFKDLTQLMEQRQQVFGDITNNFDQISDLAHKELQEETIPGLAQRFTSLTGGGQRSSGFNRQIARAGSDLKERLAILKPSMDRQDRAEKLQQMQLLQQNAAGRYGQYQDRQQKLRDIISGSYNTVTTPAQPSGWKGVLSGVAQGATLAGTIYGQNKLNNYLNPSAQSTAGQSTFNPGSLNQNYGFAKKPAPFNFGYN
ncbi:MAG TPA: hypothetical protein VMV86_06610 [Methanosarcinales archaeon]|nr:hypothetical protein [Methanosarcinales archaeon]